MRALVIGTLALATVLSACGGGASPRGTNAPYYPQATGAAPAAQGTEPAKEYPKASPAGSSYEDSGY